MTTKQRIRTRYVPTSTFTIDEDTKYYHFIGRILNISKNGIQVSNGATDCRLWIDTENFNNSHHTVIGDEFKVDQHVKLSVAFNTYINKSREFALKIILLDIEAVEDSKKEWSSATPRPEFEVSIKLIGDIKTDILGLRIIKGIRLDMYGDEFEQMSFRYYTNTIHDLKPGIYKVKFTVSNTSKIVIDTGEVYTDEEVYKLLVDGVEVEKKSKVFIPCLDIKELLMQVE